LKSILKNPLIIDHHNIVEEVRDQMSFLDTVLQAAPGMQGAQQPSGMMIDTFIFQAIMALSILIVTMGIFWVFIKLGRFLDVMKDKV